VSEVKFSASGVSEGVLYSLPTQDVSLTIEQVLVKADDLKKNIKKLKTKLKGSQTKLTKLKAADKKLGEFIKKIPDENVTYKQIKDGEKLESTQAIEDLVNLIGKTEAKLKSVEKELKDLEKKNSEREYKVKLSAKALTPYPSQNLLFSARNINNGFTHESIEIKTTAAGLLAGGTGTSRGKIDEIMVSLASAFGGIEGLKDVNDLISRESVFTLKSREIPIETDNSCKFKEFKKTIKLNLTNKDPLKKLNKELKAQKSCLKLFIGNQNDFQSQFPLCDERKKFQVHKYACTKYVKDKNNPKAPEKLDKNQFIDGLIYPRQTPLWIGVCKTDTPSSSVCKNEQLKKEISVNVINPRSLGVLKLEQGLFADNSYEFDFKNGMLTRFKSDKGNEFVSFFSMFPSMARALVSIPAEIIQLKFNLSDSEKAYYEAQTEILKQKLKYKDILDNPEQVLEE